MQGIATPPFEPRLQRRYSTLVQAHLRAADGLAAGVARIPGAASAFAATQAAWRFFNNERVELPALAEPLRAAGRQQVESLKSPLVLCAHDWSKLSFNHLKSKLDVTRLSHGTDIGYEMFASLLVSADDGQPLAPMEMELFTANGILSTRGDARHRRRRDHLDQVLPTMRASAMWGLSKPVVHVIDREADSVGHYRSWDAEGHNFLVRANDRRVLWNGESWLLSRIADALRQKRKFTCQGTASYQGRKAQLWVAETSVVLHRPAKKNNRGQKYEKTGPRLGLRMIVVQVRDGSGKVLAQWLLLTNVPESWASAGHLGRCYYWRWRIESFFKLLKAHGQQLECWQQTTGPAIARRLLVASMACVVVWQLQADLSPEAKELKDVLVRLSGRQTKRSNPHTAPALLAGLWVLLSFLALLEQYKLSEIRELAEQIDFLDSG